MGDIATEKILLGNLLVRKKLVCPDVLKECLQVQEHCQQKLGEILIEKNILSETQIDKALKEQQWRKAGLWIID